MWWWVVENDEADPEDREQGREDHGGALQLCHRLILAANKPAGPLSCGRRTIG
jgi:hypothetical protein